MNANTSMICLYWNIGRAILKKQWEEGWGTKVIDRMSKDLKIAFPEMSGFFPRKFAKCWGDYEIVQRFVAQISWWSNITLMDKLKTQEERIWYAGKTIENGWSKTILELQIQSKLMERTVKTVNNFPVVLPPLDSDMVNQIFKDPYLFDFLETDMPRREVELEQKLTEHIQSFLLELGQGFAFVGRQVHLEVGGQDILCHPDDKPTIGLLLVKVKNKTVVEYSLSGYQNTIGVADWQNQLTQSLPEEFQSSLPSIEEIEKEL